MNTELQAPTTLPDHRSLEHHKRRQRRKKAGIFSGLALAGGMAAFGINSVIDYADTSTDPSIIRECNTPQSAWIWCDDFEADRTEKYFEYEGQERNFARADKFGLYNSTALRTIINQGAVSAGRIAIAFGRTPATIPSVDQDGKVYDSVFSRFFIRTSPDFKPLVEDIIIENKVFASASVEAANAAVTSGPKDDVDFLYLNSISGTDSPGRIKNTGFKKLSLTKSADPVWSTLSDGKWHCVETRMKLNNPKKFDGLFELWVDEKLQAQKNNLNWTGAFRDYGINSVALNNSWIEPSSISQERYFDNFVVSTSRVGCGSSHASLFAPVKTSQFASVSLASEPYVVPVEERRISGNISANINQNIKTTLDIVKPAAPVLVITAPANGATVSGLITTVARSEGTSGIIGVQFFLNTIALAEEIKKAPFSLNFDTKRFADGPYTLTAVGRDESGKQTTASISIIINNQRTQAQAQNYNVGSGSGSQGSLNTQVNVDGFAPLVQIVSPKEFSTVTVGGTVEARAYDDSQIVWVEFFIDGISLHPAVTVPPFIIDFHTRDFVSGRHNLTAVAQDRAGNKTASTIQIYINKPSVWPY